MFHLVFFNLMHFMSYSLTFITFGYIKRIDGYDKNVLLLINIHY